jgi:phosphatidate cytidylyltransferase
LVAGVQTNALPGGGIASRIAAAAVLMPVAIGLTWAGSLYFCVLVLICAGLLSREWVRLCGASPDSLPGLALASGSIIILAGAYYYLRFDIAAAAGIFHYFLLRRLPAGGLPERNRVWLAAGALVLTGAGLSLIWLRTVPADGFAGVIWLFAVVWATDIAAFVFGKSVGGPRLAPAISPKKTWAGLIGGLAGAAATGFAVSYVYSGEVIALAALAGILIGLACGAGDLFESFFKRRFHAKDSGRLIPGHGGVLDRLDSLLAAAPAAVLLYSLGWRWL